jgi:hypothetical protein
MADTDAPNSLSSYLKALNDNIDSYLRLELPAERVGPKFTPNDHIVVLLNEWYSHMKIADLNPADMVASQLLQGAITDRCAANHQDMVSAYFTFKEKSANPPQQVTPVILEVFKQLGVSDATFTFDEGDVKNLFTRGKDAVAYDKQRTNEYIDRLTKVSQLLLSVMSEIYGKNPNFVKELGDVANNLNEAGYRNYCVYLTEVCGWLLAKKENQFSSSEFMREMNVLAALKELKSTEQDKASDLRKDKPSIKDILSNAQGNKDERKSVDKGKKNPLGPFNPN